MSSTAVSEVVRRSAPVSDDDLARLDLDAALGEMLAEVAREPRIVERRRRGPRPARLRGPILGIGLARPAVVALLVALVVAVAAAVPPVRAALGELGDTLAGYFDGEDSPGRPLESSDDPPAWLVSEGTTGQRVIASAEGYQLYLAREPSGAYAFGLDDSVGIGDSAAGWEREFEQNSVVILGPGKSLNTGGQAPLFGVTAGNVAEVEMHYDTGPPSKAPSQTGGFVLMIEPERGPKELVALDSAGQPVQVVNAYRFRPSAKHDAPQRRASKEVRVPRDAVDVGEAPAPDELP